ncbi:hypothetical protein [Methylocystis parvus]|uniref:Uncharacterized protein n=1 Tax=Methylocystis parvus TaxID=134 RepID=A0A6B8M7J9_9HYPH|nr:hypothetical protein [Methylocystis parvus]QGM96770.1 hypothetical protein F7D14_04300 [Methylocystis parvus]WBJ99355.1 hypothetical protein MMG94_15325 [Methylocystis parvus OBBP]
MKTKPVPAFLGAFALGLAGGVALLAMGGSVEETKKPTRPEELRRESRMLHGSAAMLAASVLADSAMEHYRGSFENPGMFAPLISSALALFSGTEGAAASHPEKRAFRRVSYKFSIAVGAAGFAFHLYNIFKRPGGLSWLNLFYGAPVGAPAALSLCGVVGLAAEDLSEQGSDAPRLLGFPAGRALAALSGVALAGAALEAALFHFRGAYQNPFMWAPVALPPVAAGLMAKASLERPKETHPLTRLWLWVTFLTGFIGMGFHAYGVSRAMGGWRNWTQNLFDGPPLPAPPSFSAAAMTALPALTLIEADANAKDRQSA